MNVLSCVGATIDGFGLDIWSNDHLQVVTANSYNIVTEFHSSQFSVCYYN
jgi:hypothetical protein